MARPNPVLRRGLVCWGERLRGARQRDSGSSHQLEENCGVMNEAFQMIAFQKSGKQKFIF